MYVGIMEIIHLIASACCYDYMWAKAPLSTMAHITPSVLPSPENLHRLIVAMRFGLQNIGAARPYSKA